MAFETSTAADFVVKNGDKESTKPGQLISVNENDVRILQRAAGILSDSTKWNRHDKRLMEYNNDPTTSFKDIKEVLDRTEMRIASQLRLKPL